MKRTGRNICKIIVFLFTTFVLSSGLTPASAVANPISKPVKIEQVSDSGGFYIYTFQEKIHQSLPEFSFDIYAIPMGRGGNYQSRRIIVSDTQTRDVVQEISLLNASRLIDYPTTSDKETMGFIIEDMNFDGYKDIRIVAFMPGGTRIPYIYWFWNNNEQKFVKYGAMEEITSPVFDPVNKSIHSPVSIPGKQSYDIVYKYVDYVPTTKEEYLRKLFPLERMEVGLKKQNNSEKKKTLNNCYKGWDEELNIILGHLAKEATPEMQENLKADQKNWLTEREKLAKEAGNKQPDDKYSLAYTYSLVLSTKNRTLEFIDLFFDGEKK